MVTCTGHISIHEGADGRTYVRTDVHDVMATKPNFLTSMGYHIFLSIVLRALAPSARAELRYKGFRRSFHCHLQHESYYQPRSQDHFPGLGWGGKRPWDRLVT